MIGEFIDTIKRGYSFDYKGRSDRKEYIIFQVGTFILAFCIGFYGDFTDTEIGAMISALTLFVIIPNIMVTIRRLHDVNLSGWVFLPFILVSTFFMVGQVALTLFVILAIITPGDKKENKYGAPVLRIKAEEVIVEKE